MRRPYPAPPTAVNPASAQHFPPQFAALGYGRLGMPLVVDVPLNTAIADLDEALRMLLRRELERHGFEGVEIAFDAPSKEWSGKLTSPTVDLFLYDLREAVERAPITPDEERGNGQAIVTPPPLRLELTYAVTAWTKAVEDEHRLLSQVLAILFSYRRLPPDVLDGRARRRLAARRGRDVGRPPARGEGRLLDARSAASTRPRSTTWCTSRSSPARRSCAGPEVRTQTMRTRLSDGPARTMTEFHRIGGTVARRRRGAGRRRVGRACPSAGLWAATDGDGPLPLRPDPARRRTA